MLIGAQDERKQVRPHRIWNIAGTENEEAVFDQAVKKPDDMAMLVKVSMIQVLDLAVAI